MEKPPRKKMIEPRLKEEKWNKAGSRSGGNTVTNRRVCAEFLADGRRRGKGRDEEGAKKDGRGRWTGCRLEDRRGQGRAMKEWRRLDVVDKASSAGRRDGDNIRRAWRKEGLEEKRRGIG